MNKYFIDWENGWINEWSKNDMSESLLAVETLLHLVYKFIFYTMSSWRIINFKKYIYLAEKLFILFCNKKQQRYTYTSWNGESYISWTCLNMLFSVNLV